MLNRRLDCYIKTDMATCQGEGNLWIQTCKFYLKSALCNIMLKLRYIYIYIYIYIYKQEFVLENQSHKILLVFEVQIYQNLKRKNHKKIRNCRLVDITVSESGGKKAQRLKIHGQYLTIAKTMNHKHDRAINHIKHPWKTVTVKLEKKFDFWYISGKMNTSWSQHL